MLSTTRHLEIFDTTEHGGIPVHVIGAGAIGSHLCMSLAELGMRNVTVYDFDEVEPHNLANQAYEAQHIGMTKLDALKHLVAAKLGYAPEGWNFVPGELLDGSHMTGLVFMAIDTMHGRKDIGPTLTNMVYCIEVRMSSSYGNILGFSPRDIPKWLGTLTDDDKAEVSACGSSISVGPTAKITANLAVWQMINFITLPEAVAPRTNFYLQPLMFGQEELNPAIILGDVA